MSKRTPSTTALRDAFTTLRTRVKNAGATKVLKELDRLANDDDAILRGVSALFVHTSLARGIEDDVAEALAIMNDQMATDALVIGLRSKRVVLRRAAARALCIAPSSSREIREALQWAASASRDANVRAACEKALALVPP